MRHTEKNVYLVSFEYFPISQGGLARHAKAVIDRLLVHKVFKAVIAVPMRDKIEINRRIVTIPCLFFKNKYLCYLEFSFRVLLKLIYRFNKDTFVFFSLLSYFLIPLLPKKFYLFVHSNEKRVFLTDYPGESIKERFIRKSIYFINYQWESFLCRKARRVFSVSPSLKEETVQQYKMNRHNITVITNGLDKRVFSKGTGQKKLNKDLLYVGKISPRKNISDLIEILKLLTNSDPQFKLHIMGSGEKSYLNKIRSMIHEYKLDSNVFFHPYRTDVELNTLYEKCSIFVTTSLVEGFGLVVLEAMSKGLPVVVYENLGVRDIIINKTNGYLIKRFDYQSFVNKILYLYKNKNIYNKMSDNAIKRVNDFRWGPSVKKLVKEIG